MTLEAAQPVSPVRVLMTISGSIAELESPSRSAGTCGQTASPRRDYEELHVQLGYDLIDEGTIFDESKLARGLRRIAGRHVAFASMVFLRRGRYQAIVTDAESTGIVLAGLLKLFGSGGCKHLMISHILSSKQKPFLLRTLGLKHQIDKFIVYSSAQKDFAEQVLGVDPAKVDLIKFGVDDKFFCTQDNSGDSTATNGTAVVVSVGAEARDYDTLLAAVDGLDCEAKMAAGSHWSTSQWDQGRALPANVELLDFLTILELRRLYEQASVVVVPLHETQFQAGLTSIIEAMAMSRPVVYSKTSGQTDTVVDGQTGVGVPPGDVVALRVAIQRLLDDRVRCKQLGSSGRTAVETGHAMDIYVAEIGRVVTEVLA